MVVPLRRTWGFAALASALGACAAQLAAQRHAGIGMMTLARASAAGTAARALPVARWHAAQSGLWGGVGLASAVLAIGGWVVARRAGGPAPDAALSALLIAYALLVLLIV